MYGSRRIPPTLGHIGQMCLAVADSDWRWAFIKSDRKAAYKNLASAPDLADFRLAKLRAASESKRYGLRLKEHPSGASDAVLRRN